MFSGNISNSLLKSIFYLISFIVAGYIIFELKIIVGYLLIASILSLIVRPIVKFLSFKLKLGSTLASVVAIIFILIVISGIISLLIPLILEQGKNLSLLNVNAFQDKINTLLNELSEYLIKFNINLNESLFDIEGLTKNSVEAIPILLNSIGSILGSITIGVLSVIFITFFMLKDGEYFEKLFILLFPTKMKKRIEKSISEIKSLLSRYFLGLLFQITILFTIYTIVLLIFGVKDAVVIAFLCALLNLIPYIGPLIGIVLMSFLTMTSYLGEDFSSIIIPSKSVTKPGIINKKPAIFWNNHSLGSLTNFSICLKSNFDLIKNNPIKPVRKIKETTTQKPRKSPSKIKPRISKIGISKINL